MTIEYIIAVLAVLIVALQVYKSVSGTEHDAEAKQAKSFLKVVKDYLKSEKEETQEEEEEEEK